MAAAAASTAVAAVSAVANRMAVAAHILPP